MSPARADPSSKCFGGCEKLEEKQKPLPTRVLLLAPVWMFCPGRIRPNPFLIKKYICIPDKQCPMPAGKLPAQLSFFSLLWPHHDANTELSSHLPQTFPQPCAPPSPNLLPPFQGISMKTGALFLGIPLPVPPSACARLCPPQTRNKRGRDGENMTEPPNGLVWASNCP